jgi:hypothetical protein
MKTKEQLSEEYSPKDRATIYSQLICDRERAAFIAGYEAAQRWIPIEEEMPTVDEKVFVRYEIIKGCEDFTAAEIDCNETWHDNGNELHYNPTHWLPIPKLPTK